MTQSAMTEQQVQELEEQVGEVNMADPVVQNMLLVSIQEQEKSLRELKGMFRVFKLMRNDERMKTIAKQVEEVKKLLETLKGLVVTKPVKE